MGQRKLEILNMQTAPILFGEVPEHFNGSGSGDGCGYGYGSGYGSGCGYGYGSGYGSGDGDGCGYGYGSGDDCGYGYGSGYGYGCGYGDGSGSGDGSKEYWAACVEYMAARWPAKQRLRLAECQAQGLTIAYWRSDARGKACNGGKNDPVQPGTVEEIPGPLKICTRNALHATLIPPAWQGERVWIVAMHGEVQWQEDKCGALKREILGEVTATKSGGANG